VISLTGTYWYPSADVQDLDRPGPSRVLHQTAAGRSRVLPPPAVRARGGWWHNIAPEFWLVLNAECMFINGNKYFNQY